MYPGEVLAKAKQNITVILMPMQDFGQRQYPMHEMQADP
jgi:hypothetical protein